MHFQSASLASRTGSMPILSKLVLGGLGIVASVLGTTSQAHAAKVFNTSFLLPSGPELFNLKIETEDTTTTVTMPVFAAPASCQPASSADCAGVVVGSPQLQSPGYKFTGYKVTKVTGTAHEGGLTYDILGIGSAGTSGVFNYPTTGNLGPAVSPDSIPHSAPDQLYNPGEPGLGFDPTGFSFGTPAAFTSFPATSLQNFFSFGGITFDIGEFMVPGDESSFVIHEPYQLFTVAYDSTSTTTGEPVQAGGYAGCPGSCKKAVPVPGPLPILGFASAFAFSRRLRQRVQSTTTSLAGQEVVLVD